MRLAYAMVKFSVNNGKSLQVTVPTVARVQRHDLAAIADPNVRVETARSAGTTTGSNKPKAGIWSSPNQAF